jgi:hypothetical protein
MEVELSEPISLSSKLWEKVSIEQAFLIYQAIKDAYYQTQLLYELIDFTEEEMPLQRQSIGHLRASIISKKLIAIPLQSGIEVSICQNQSGSYSYAQIVISGSVILTVKSSELPDQSDYREKLAKLNKSYTSMTLFDYFPDEFDFDDHANSQIKTFSNNTDNQINAIISHKSNSSGTLKHLAIIFPDHKYKKILEKPIDLLEMCQGLTLNSEFTKNQRNLESRPAPVEVEKQVLKLKNQGGGA